MTRNSTAPYLDPDAWVAAAPHKEGSWWPAWIAWLEARSGQPVRLAEVSALEPGYPAVADAPGSYVLQE